MDKVKLGAKLRALRGDRTLEMVSRETGLGRTALNMYELGHRVPRDEAKIILADYYKKSVEELFFERDAT